MGRDYNRTRERVHRTLLWRLHDLCFCGLRDACASLSNAAAAHPKLISARLGQSSVTITLDRYRPSLPEHGRGAGREARRGEGDALHDLAEVLAAGGKRAEAVGVLEQALSRYEHKRDLPDAARARALLDQWT